MSHKPTLEPEDEDFPVVVVVAALVVEDFAVVEVDLPEVVVVADLVVEDLAVVEVEVDLPEVVVAVLPDVEVELLTGVQGEEVGAAVGALVGAVVDLPWASADPVGSESAKEAPVSTVASGTMLSRSTVITEPEDEVNRKVMGVVNPSPEVEV
jgi:hypothetical protein